MEDLNEMNALSWQAVFASLNPSPVFESVAMLAEAMKIADLIRLELHGPASELEKLKTPLAHLNPTYFITDKERGE